MSTARILFHSIRGLALTFSSLFFIALFLFTVFAPAYSDNGQMVTLTALVILVVYNALSRNDANILRFHIAGSLIFFIYFLSFYLQQDSIFARLFELYYKKVEYALNLGLVSFLMPIIVFILVLDAILASIDFAEKKHGRSAGTPRKIWFSLQILGSVSVILVTILFFFGSTPLISKKIFEMSEASLPFIGFSLLYIHAHALLGLIIPKSKTTRLS